MPELSTPCVHFIAPPSSFRPSMWCLPIANSYQHFVRIFCFPCLTVFSLLHSTMSSACRILFARRVSAGVCFCSVRPCSVFLSRQNVTLTDWGCSLCGTNSNFTYYSAARRHSPGRPMSQEVSRRPLTTEARVRFRVSLREICGIQSANGTGFTPSSLVFPCQYHSTIAPRSCCTY